MEYISIYAKVSVPRNLETLITFAQNPQHLGPFSCISICSWSTLIRIH